MMDTAWQIGVAASTLWAMHVVAEQREQQPRLKATERSLGSVHLPEAFSLSQADTTNDHRNALG